MRRVGPAQVVSALLSFCVCTVLPFLSQTHTCAQLVFPMSSELPKSASNKTQLAYPQCPSKLLLAQTHVVAPRSLGDVHPAGKPLIPVIYDHEANKYLGESTDIIKYIEVRSGGYSVNRLNHSELYNWVYDHEAE